MNDMRARPRDFRATDAFYATLLGVLIAVGPLGIDMYLPAFPAIARDLGVSTGLVQVSLVAYFLSLAFGQLLYGPLSDRFGRRAPLIWGTGLFVLTSLAITRAPNIGWLIGLRFLQGAGGCAGTTIARAILRDVASGPAAAKLYSRMILVFGVAPILSPVFGGAVLQRFDWRALFVIMAAYGIAMMLIVAFVMRETHPRAHRAARVGTAFAAYGMLLRQRPFLVTVSIGAFMQGAFFAYLAGSPYVFITLHGLSSLQYGVLFGMNAFALIAASQVLGRVVRRIGAVRMVRIAALVATLAAGVACAAGDPRVSVFVPAACVFVLVMCQGFISPASSLMAMEPYPEVAGAASALVGMTLYAFGTASAAVVSALFNGTAYPMTGVMLGCAAASTALSLARRDPARATE